MIKSITITNYLGKSIVIDMLNPWSSGFAIKSITGLGPPMANINQTDLASADGSRTNSTRVTGRNIVLTLYPLSNSTVEEMRIQSYKYFPIKQRLKFTIETDTRKAYTYGYVESNEPDIFSQSETQVISIVCDSPYFTSFESNVVLFHGITSVFEFPFENNSLEDDLIEFSTIQQTNSANVYYSGDAENGVEIEIHAIGVASGLTIYNLTTRDVMKIDDDLLAAITGSGIVAGDTITIDTVKGEKSIVLLRNGVSTNILNTLGKNPNWFQLVQGDNVFAYTVDIGNDNLEFRILTNILYEGV